MYGNIEPDPGWDCPDCGHNVATGLDCKWCMLDDLVPRPVGVVAGSVTHTMMHIDQEEKSDEDER